MSATHNPELELIYFDAPGRAFITRVCLNAAGIPFKDTRLNYEQVQAMKTTHDDKYLGQVPVLVVDGVMITQSAAHYRYVGRLANMYPVEPEAQLPVDEVLEIVSEFFYKIPRHENKEQQLKLRKEFAEGYLVKAVGQLDAIVARNRHGDYTVGNSLTVADLGLLNLHMSLGAGWYEGLSTALLQPFVNVRRVIAKALREPCVIPQLPPSLHPKITVTYFNVPGRAFVTRYCLRVAGLPYEDKRVDGAEFIALKPTLPMGQLPVLDVGGVLYTQSSAHYRFAGRLAGLYPLNPLLQLRVDEVLEVLAEIMYKAPTSTDQAEKKRVREEFAAGPLIKFCKHLDNIAARNSKPGVMVGDSVTVADLLMAATVSMISTGGFDYISKEYMNDYKNLVRVYETVKVLPASQGEI